MELHTLLKQGILPAITFEKSTAVLPVAETILKAGLNVLEITFRTQAAADAILLIRKHLPEMHVGAGTLLNKEQVRRAIDAGAEFGLSPGFNPSLVAAAQDQNLPFIPGVLTPSEIEMAAEMGFLIQKIFPIQQIGGLSYLQALEAPYTQLGVQFIPMGGVNPQNFRDYLALKNVIAVGGSWIATKELIATQNYAQIALNIRECTPSV